MHGSPQDRALGLGRRLGVNWGVTSSRKGFVHLPWKRFETETSAGAF